MLESAYTLSSASKCAQVQAQCRLRAAAFCHPRNEWARLVAGSQPRHITSSYVHADLGELWSAHAPSTRTRRQLVWLLLLIYATLRSNYRLWSMPLSIPKKLTPDHAHETCNCRSMLELFANHARLDIDDLTASGKCP